LSLQCARCHDHKYDPISQREYYRFFAFFNSSPDKQANYANFLAAEPYLRVPSPAQLAQIQQLGRERHKRERAIRNLDAEAKKALARWENGLIPKVMAQLEVAGWRTATVQALLRRLFLAVASEDYRRWKAEAAALLRQEAEVNKRVPAVMVML